MLNAVLALNELDTNVFDSPSPGAAPRIYDSHIAVPDAHLLFNGQFERVGSNDLKIVGEDGQSFFIPNYFASDTRAHLMSPQGATLSASVVEALAGPLAPGQHAQAGGQAASTQPVIGRVDALSGSATVVRNGVTVVLNVGDTVRKGDVVQTSGSSSVAIVFTDGSTFSLNANARMVLDDFVYAAGGTGNSALISLVQGSFSFVAGQVAKTGDMRVETPVATMGIRGTAVLVEISANDGQTRFSVMVEPDGTTGSFNLYNKTTGTLIGTVSNSQIGWVVTPAGPLQVVAQQVQKTPGELAQELGIVQQIFTIFDNNQQNPFVPTQDRGDNPNNANPQTAQGGGGSGGALVVNVPITTPDNPTPTNVTVTITPVGSTNTPTTPTGPTPIEGSPPLTPDIPVVPTLNVINGSGNITGTPGNDQITGSDGDDTVDALAGNDFVFAGDGDDIIVAAHGGGNDFYDGGTHIHGDTIKFESANGVVFNLNNGTFNLGAGGTVKSSTAQSDASGTDVFVRVEKVVGSAGNDVFILNDTADWEIDAGAGIDIVRLANGVDFPDSENGPEITNWEIADLATDTEQNIVSFEVGDFDNIGDEGVILDRAPLRILGGENDIIQITNHEGIEGYWVSAGTFVDPAQDGTETDPFNDHFTDGVTFNVYQFVSGEQVIGTAYVEQGVQIVLPNEAPIAGDVTLEANVLGNGGFEALPNFEGWTIDLGTDLRSVSFSNAVIDRSGTIFQSDGAVAVLSFSGQVSEPGDAGSGPSILSDVFSGNAGDTIRFIYQLSSGNSSGSSDRGTVVGRIIDVETGDVLQEIYNEADLGQSTGVQTVNVELQYSGEFRIEFEVGSVDDTHGYVVGARLDLGFAGILRTGVSEDAPFTFSQDAFIANASDADGDTLTLNSVATSLHGALVYINLDGTVTYDPSTAAAIQALGAGETIEDTFTFTLRDEHGALSGEATATVTVQGQNDAPTSGDVSAEGTEDASVIAITLTGDDIDGTVTGFKLNSLPLHGELSLDGFSTVLESKDLQQILSATNEALTLYFRPDENWNGETSFGFVAVDNNGAESEEAATATINVAAVNAAPVIHNEEAGTYESYGEGEYGTTLYGLRVTDDDAAETDIFHVAVTAEHGTLSPANPLLNNEGPQDPQSLSFQATLADINNALSQGVVYNDPEYNGENSELVDTVTLTVTDADNNSDSMNFIFSVFGDAGATLIGTTAKDVMFSTGHNDSFTGGGDNDTFVFGDESGYGSGQDIIIDFTQGQDRIALYGYADMSDLTIAFVDGGRSTQIDLGDGNSVTLSGFNVTLTANDFIFHPSNMLVA